MQNIWKEREIVALESGIAAKPQWYSSRSEEFYCRFAAVILRQSRSGIPPWAELQVEFSAKRKV